MTIPVSFVEGTKSTIKNNSSCYTYRARFLVIIAKRLYFDIYRSMIKDCCFMVLLIIELDIHRWLEVEPKLNHGWTQGKRGQHISNCSKNPGASCVYSAHGKYCVILTGHCERLGTPGRGSFDGGWLRGRQRTGGYGPYANHSQKQATDWGDTITDNKARIMRCH